MNGIDIPCAARLAASSLVLAAVAGCGGSVDAGLGGIGVLPSTACDALAGTRIDPSAIGVRNGGAQVQTATLVAATDTLPQYCLVTGAIAPVDELRGFPINFRVNLPSAWNERAMHFGGSGYNGTVVSGTGPAPSAPPSVPVPLARGYATFGSDSGHGIADASFALREDALVDFGYEQVKKTHDVAVELIRRRYGKLPAHTYWVGSSQGGREGLMAAQRFPADYDGILASVPVLSFTGLQLQGNRVGRALALPGAWLSDAKVNALQQAALAACDGDDGLLDQTIAHYTGCRFDPLVLSCANGIGSPDTCLTDAELNTVITLHTPMDFGFQVANGVTRYPGWHWGSEDDPDGNWTLWVTGTSALGNGGLIVDFGNQFVRYFIVQDPNFNPLSFVPSAYRARIQRLSEQLDATDPNLSAFRARGGKLIIQERGGDYAHSPVASLDYHDAVVATLGPANVDQFLRLYLTPGASHLGVPTSGWPATGIDWVAILEAWVENGTPPADMLELVQQTQAAPYTVIARRPLCRYPTYPHYGGVGDADLLASYSCQLP